MTENEKKIYELIKQEYGEYSCVTIFVNCETFDVSKSFPTDIKVGVKSMRNINGEFIKEN